MDEQKLNEMYELTKDNNKMLKAIRRDAFVGGIMQFIWWILVIVVIPYISWLFIQPYLETMLGTYSAVQGKANAIQGAANIDMTQIQDLLKQFGVTGK